MIVPFAAVAALVMLAQLVAGRAARDALFLVTFGPDALPYAMAASGVVSVAGAIPLSRALARFGPGRAVPWLFAGSAGLFLLEWSLVDAQARVVAIVLYLHLAAASSLLISGFWGVLNERFDPHSARASLARVASFATAGGMLGGILSERTATYFGLDATLVVMAGMHGLCALLVGAVGRAETLAPKTALEEGEDESALALVRGSPYLRWMVATTLLLALLDAQIDFALRAGAAGELGSGESLVRFFGLYYTAVGVLTFAIQSGLTARIVGRFGIGPSMTAMPVSILLASVAALLVPGLPAYVVMHGAGSVLIHSIYRTGFELLYTPLPLRIKRPAKPLIDVGGDGVGDVLGAGMIVVVIAVAPHADLIGVTLLAMVLSVAMVVVLSRLQSAYREQLARNLQLGEISFDEMDTLARSVGETHVKLDRAEVLAHLHETGSGRGRAVSAGRPEASGLRELIALLGDPGHAREAAAALVEKGEVAVEPLLEALADADGDELTQLMLPGILEHFPERRVIEALLSTTAAAGFEVRFRSIRVAARMGAAAPSLLPDPSRVLRALREELANPTPAPPPQAASARSDRPDSVLIPDHQALRVGRRVEHVFTLLSLEAGIPLARSVLLGLHSDSAAFRGTALEYLEASLPDEIRRGLPQVLGERAASMRTPSRRVRAARQLEAELLRAAQARIVEGER